MADSPRPRTLRAAYLMLYTLGGCCTAVCVVLLAWVAFCIAMEKSRWQRFLSCPTSRPPSFCSSSWPSWSWESSAGNGAPGFISVTKSMC